MSLGMIVLSVFVFSIPVGLVASGVFLLVRRLKVITARPLVSARIDWRDLAPQADQPAAPDPLAVPVTAPSPQGTLIEPSTTACASCAGTGRHPTMPYLPCPSRCTR